MRRAAYAATSRSVKKKRIARKTQKNQKTIVWPTSVRALVPTAPRPYGLRLCEPLPRKMRLVYGLHLWRFCAPRMAYIYAWPSETRLSAPLLGHLTPMDYRCATSADRDMALTDHLPARLTFVRRIIRLTLNFAPMDYGYAAPRPDVDGNRSLIRRGCRESSHGCRPYPPVHEPVVVVADPPRRAGSHRCRPYLPESRCRARRVGLSGLWTTVVRANLVLRNGADEPCKRNGLQMWFDDRAIAGHIRAS
jgi:hypothetical protein